MAITICVVLETWRGTPSALYRKATRRWPNHAISCSSRDTHTNYTVNKSLSVKINLFGCEYKFVAYIYIYILILVQNTKNKHIFMKKGKYEIGLLSIWLFARKWCITIMCLNRTHYPITLFIYVHCVTTSTLSEYNTFNLLPLSHHLGLVSFDDLLVGQNRVANK